jgi:hypothetical protein
VHLTAAGVETCGAAVRAILHAAPEQPNLLPRGTRSVLDRLVAISDAGSA